MKLRVLALHPIQYQAPLWRAMARDPRVSDFKVWFTWRGLHGREAYDPGFDRAFAWDVDLTSGFEHSFLANFSPDPAKGGPFRRINPGILARLLLERPDALLIVGHGTVSSILALVATRVAGVPTMLYGDYSAPDRPSRALFRRAVVRLATYGAAVGRRNRLLYEEARIPPERIVDVPFSIENARFAQPPGCAPSGRPFVVSVAKFLEHKRQVDILEALARIPTAKRPLVRLVGSGPRESALRERVASLGVGEDVEFRGFVNYSAIPEEYHGAHASVLASSSEPWGLAVNESMAAGVAAIVTDICGCADELVLEGETGAQYPTGDIERLSELLADVAACPARWRAMGVRAAQHISRFDVSEAACAIINGFERARDGRRDPQAVVS